MPVVSIYLNCSCTRQELDRNTWAVRCELLTNQVLGQKPNRELMRKIKAFSKTNQRPKDNPYVEALHLLNIFWSPYKVEYFNKLDAYSLQAP
jgi:hypothetical protein